MARNGWRIGRRGSSRGTRLTRSRFTPRSTRMRMIDGVSAMVLHSSISLFATRRVSPIVYFPSLHVAPCVCLTREEL